MAEANAAEPNERAALTPRRPRRKHVINLCCAQSVHRVVEEVARNLEGLGFRTTVVTGAEARAALLGSRTDSEQPTIHVVCVQGSMQERVLKPLRQALATHGGPNHHLFVAVLDLGVPLAMVGQIRRFAEALERSAPPSAPTLGLGASGREASRDLEQAPTRSYPTVAQVPERGGTRPPPGASEGDDAGERPSRRTRPRVAKIGPTSKYQAVTASHPVVTEEPGVRKRRRPRSRMSPAPPRPAGERVVGLPPEQSRQPGAREQPPPPPAPGGLRRRSPPTGPVASAAPPPPPLLSKTPSSTSLPAAGGPSGEREVRAFPRKPTGPARIAGAPEPDRATPRVDPGFRFSPPGVKSADARRQSGPVPAAADPDKTLVEGVLVDVPRTASTLRLDEPPFATALGDGSGDDEPAEPTMILTAPRGMAPVQIDEEELEPPVTGRTVVGPPPKPAPAVLDALERGRRDAATQASAPSSGAEPADRATGPRKTVGYLEREERPAAAKEQPAASERTKTLVSESSRTLLHPPPGSAREPARPPMSSESSGDIVLRPRSAGTDDDFAFESSSTLVQRPRGTGETKASTEQASVPATSAKAAEARVPAPPAAQSDAQQGAFKAGKTVLYADSAIAPMPAEPSAAAQASPVAAPTSKPDATVVSPAPTSKPDATVVSPAPAPASKPDATVVSPAPASKPDATVAAPASKPDATVVAPAPASKPDAAVAAKPTGASGLADAGKPPNVEEREINAPVAARSASGRKLPPSAVPTERHPQADLDAKPARRSRSKQIRAARPPERAPTARAGILSSAPDAPPSSAGVAMRPRTKPSGSRYGWLWIMLALLTAGGGWGAYQAGLLDGVLGRRPEGTTVADAGAPRQPEPPAPSDPTPRTSAADAGAAEAGAADAGAAEAGAADAGAAEAGAADVGAAEAGAADAGAAEADSAQPAASTKAEAGDEPASAGAPPAATTGGPEPAAGDTTGTPDQPDDDGPDQPDDDGPDQPDDDGGSTQPPTTSDAPEPTPGAGPRLSPEEEKLSDAVSQRRIFMMKTLFTTRRQGEETTFAAAWRLCGKLEVDGVKGWRLPHRREMKLVNAVLNLPQGVYWTRTVPREDRSSAYVLDTNDGSLSLALKSDPNGDVVCVRERDFPEK